MSQSTQKNDLTHQLHTAKFAGKHTSLRIEHSLGLSVSPTTCASGWYIGIWSGPPRNFRRRASRSRKLSRHPRGCLHNHRHVFGGLSLYQTVSRVQKKNQKSRTAVPVLS